jgi:NADH:ubiquinone oxidoreductase subunit C
LGTGVKEVCIISGFEIEVGILSKNIYIILFFVSKHTLFKYKTLVDIVCYDILGETCRFFLVYNLLSISNSMRLQVFTRVGTYYDVLSIVGIFRCVA